MKPTFAQALQNLRDDIHDLCANFEKKHGKAKDSDTEMLTVTGEIMRGGVKLRASIETSQS